MNMVILAAAKFDSINENDENKSKNINISKYQILLLYILQSMNRKYKHTHKALKKKS